MLAEQYCVECEGVAVVRDGITLNSALVRVGERPRFADDDLVVVCISGCKRVRLVERV